MKTLPLSLLRRSTLLGVYAKYVKSKRRVQGGIFKGMNYVTESIGSQFWPKILGTYECELNPLFRRLSLIPLSRIVDVGAAEGYFAVGAALRWSTAQVIAFESEPVGRKLVRKMADLNSVGHRIKILGECSSEIFSENLEFTSGEQSLCIMDVDAAESNLLDPNTCPQLTRCHILVETHEFAIPGITNILHNRFEKTHNLESYMIQPRTSNNFRESVPASLRLFFGRSLPYLVDEWRHSDCLWLYMRPNEDV